MNTLILQELSTLNIETTLSKLNTLQELINNMVLGLAIMPERGQL